MGCFVRKRPCFGKGGPSGGRKGRCLPRAKGPSPAQDQDLRASSTQAGQLRQGAPPFQERKEHPVPLPCARGRSGTVPQKAMAYAAPSVRTGKKRLRDMRANSFCRPFRAHGEEAGGLSPCTAHREEAGACPCPHPGPGHRRGPLAPFRPATAEKEKPRSKAGCISLWGERWDLNPRPPGPQPGALPTELLPP